MLSWAEHMVFPVSWRGEGLEPAERSTYSKPLIPVLLILNWQGPGVVLLLHLLLQDLLLIFNLL